MWKGKIPRDKSVICFIHLNVTVRHLEISHIWLDKFYHTIEYYVSSTVFGLLTLVYRNDYDAMQVSSTIFSFLTLVYRDDYDSFYF